MPSVAGHRAALIEGQAQLVNCFRPSHKVQVEGPIVIAGAGSIGCFVGGLLAAGGRRVRLLARPLIADQVIAHGLHLTSFEGWSMTVPPGSLPVSTDPAEALAGAAMVLVTVKSGATLAMAELIARHAPPEALVVSLQNGLSNAETLRRALPKPPVLAGMVPFNVVQLGHGGFHKGTSGNVLIEDDRLALELLNVPHLPIAGHPDMRAVLAGKLLLNLNNALNALSGQTLFEELGNRGWRRILADCQEEGLRVLDRLGIEPWSMSKLPARRIPKVLRLPNFLYRQLFRSTIRIDRTARSSMLEDLERRRPTEIDELQGWVVRTAAELGIPVPVNQAVLSAIRQAEAVGAGSPKLTPEHLRMRGGS